MELNDSLSVESQVEHQFYRPAFCISLDTLYRIWINLKQIFQFHFQDSLLIFTISSLMMMIQFGLRDLFYFTFLRKSYRTVRPLSQAMVTSFPDRIDYTVFETLPNTLLFNQSRSIL
jgi:hypothetical protein